jgi:acyl transferase domain-containing protein/acyl carrier protein
VYAVIKGSAINNDGSLKLGFTAPSVAGQAKVIKAAQSMAEVDPETIGYVEAHGTGTALGDPIEITALTQAFAGRNGNKRTCAIGSIKTNIGHLNSAAGAAGLIKVSSALSHKQIPPSLHFQAPNPEIDFENSPFFVNTTLRPWPRETHPRRAAVSSFGLGGTNAHVVLEEAPTLPPSGPGRSYQLLLLSAKTDTALEAVTHNLADYLQDYPDVPLADVAYSLAVGRQRLAYRRYVVCRDGAEAIAALRAGEGAEVMSQVEEKTDRPVMFMFTGQGAQYADMGRGLYEEGGVFRKEVDACCETLMSHLDLDLRDILYPQKGQEEQATLKLQETRYTQPALFVLEYALAKLWMSWGVTPQAMLGHSIGEYVAACLAGVFSVEDALRVVAARGRLMQAMPTGAMLSVGLSEKDVVPYLDEPLSLAAHNSPSHCVVSGPGDAILALHERLQKQEVSCQLLRTSHAFHSAMMDGMLEAFSDSLRRVQLSPPQMPFVSNLTGRWITDDEATSPEYWSRHIRHTVRFSEGVERLLESPEAILLEVGPGQTLTGLARQHRTRFPSAEFISSFRHPQKPQSDVAFLLGAVGQLWLCGAKVSWEGVYAHAARQRVPLPTYPFDRKRYWVRPGKPSESFQARSLGKRADVGDWFYTPSWERSATPLSHFEKGASAERRRWLILVDSYGIGAAVVEELQALDQELVVLEQGSEFAQTSENSFQLCPGNREDYATLVGLLIREGRAPDKIVHLWSVTEQPVQASAEAIELSKILDQGLYSLLYLAQAMERHHHTSPTEFVVVSTNLQEVTGSDPVVPEKATLLGACKGLPREFPSLTCRSVDLALPSTDNQRTRVRDQLVAELRHGSADPVIAYRGPHRLVQTFAPIKLERPTLDAPRIRPQGVYLITGGLGGIGLVLADWLARTAQARLVLTQRSALPGRAEWESWLAQHDEEDGTSRKIRAVLALEASGAEVLVCEADVSERAQVQEVVTRAQQRFGTVNGVIHAAGVADGVIFQRRTREETEKILAPKVTGTRVLAEQFQGGTLDFMVLCSSLASVLGPFAQMGYCAANAFQDAYANQQMVDGGCFTVSINWDTWQEVGMAVQAAKQLDEMFEKRKSGSGTVPQPEETQHRMAEPESSGENQGDSWRDQLKAGIRSEEGADVFRRILSTSLPQVLVSTQDFLPRLQQSDLKRAKLLGDAIEEPEEQRDAHPRPSLKSSYVGPRDELEEQLANMWQQALGIEGIGVHDDFFQLGGHSLVAIQFLNELRQQVGVELSLEDMFEGPTIEALARAIRNIGKAGPSEEMRPVTAAMPDSRDVVDYSDEEVDSLLRDLLPQKPAK